MDRRLLIGAAGAGLFGALGTRVAAQPAGPTAESVADAWFAGLPLIEMAAARVRMLDLSKPGQKAGINAFRHSRALVSSDDRTITTPNNDTLYSSAWIDLTKGPVTLTVPPTGKRYFSVAVMDMYTNNNIILGAGTQGGAAGTWTLVGPDHAGSTGPRTLKVSTPHAWVLARTLVDGEADITAAHKVQDALILQGPTAGPYPAYATRADPPAAYFDSVERLLASDPPRSRAGFGALGALKSADPKRVQEGVEAARRSIADARGRMRFEGGWQYPQPDLGDYGDDFRYRGLIAVGGLGALTVDEAMYMRAAGDTGKGFFHGDGPFRLTLPQAIPVNAFWSLTMYEATPDGQFFLTPNPLKRYAIGDRTPGLKRGSDGALEIWLGRNDPGEARRSNWLPAPRSGPWSITLRAYLPKAELREGRYRLPPVTAA